MQEGVRWRGSSAVGALEHQLQLAYGGAADVEHGPAGGQKDRGDNEQEPCVHGWEVTAFADLTDFPAAPSWRPLALIQFAAIQASPAAAKPGSLERPAWAMASWR